MTAKSVLVACAAGVVGVGSVSAQVVDWAGLNNANWSIGSNWNPAMVPMGASAVARFDSFAGRAIVNSSVPSIGAVELLDPNSILAIDNAGTLTLLGGTSTNNGLIELNRFGSSVNATLNIAGAVAFNGTGDIRMRASTDNAIILGTGSITNGAMHEIRGVGQILVPIINNGRVAGDSSVSVSGLDLEIRGDVANSNQMAAAIGTLEIFSAVTQTPSAEITAEAGNVVLFDGSSITGGTITDTGGSGHIFSNVSGTVTLDSVINTGSLTTVQPNATFSIVGSGLVNDGVIQLNQTGSSANAVLVFDESGVLNGSGELRMRTFADNAQLNTAMGQNITHGVNHTVRGVGQLNASLDNAGTILADVGVSLSGNTLELQTENKTNTGLLGAAPSSILSIESIDIDQAGGGEIRADAAGSVRFIGNNSVSSGSITSHPDGAVNVSASSDTTFDDVDIDADFFIDAGGDLFIAAGGITNNRRMEMNPFGSANDSTLTANVSTTIGGSGEIQMRTFSDNARIETMPGAVLTNAAGHTIRGVGQINAELINNGTVSADVAVSVSGAVLELQSGAKTNNGTMTAELNSTLSLDPAIVTQSPSASIVANNGGIVTIAGGSSITGGSLLTNGTGAIRTFAAADTTLSGVVFDGLMQIELGTSVIVDAAGIVNNGLIEMNRFGSASDSILTLADAAVSGTGEIRMRAFSDNTQLNTAPGTSATLGAGQLVRGVGEINGAITNDGEIRADVGVSVSGSSLELKTEDKVNNGLARAVTNSSLLLNGIAFDQSAGGMLLADGGTVSLGAGAALIGGSLDSSGAGLWATNVGGFSVDGTLLGGNGRVNLGQTMTVLGGALLNDAMIQVNPFLSAADGVIELGQSTSFVGSGSIELVASNLDARISAAPMTTPTLTNGAGHSLIGNGTVETPLVNEGILRPGRPTGTMNASSGFTQNAAGTFVATISTNNSNGRLAVTGDANLGGTLELQLGPSAVLTNNFNHIILTAGAVNGTFDSAPLLTSGQLVTRIRYEPTQVVIRTRCRADTNLDGAVTPADFNAWIAAFNTGDSVADQNLDGLVTPADFNAWILNFNTPCP